MKQLLSLLIYLFISPSLHADFYQCVNETGGIAYRDSPCNEDENLNKVIDAEAMNKKTSIFEPEIDGSTPLGKNLIKNPSFEQKLSDWQIPLGALWTSDGGIYGTGSLVINAKKPPEDKYIHETIVEQCVTLDHGEKFELSAQFRTDRAPQKAYANRANVIWYESLDCSSGGQWGAYIEPKQYTTGWQKLRRKNLTPALDAKAAKITIVQNGRFSKGAYAYWDNIFFAPTQLFDQSAKSSQDSASEIEHSAIGKDYISNGGFDDNIKSWRPGWPTEWSGTQGDVSPGSAEVTANSLSHSIGRTAFSQCINLDDNKSYELGASFKRKQTSTQTGSGRLRVSWYQKQNCSGRVKTGKSADPEDSSGWQKLRITDLTAPQLAKSASITVIQSIAGKGRFTAYWDDIYFRSAQ